MVEQELRCRRWRWLRKPCESYTDRSCPGTFKVNEGKADPETLGGAKWNLRSRGQGGFGNTWRGLLGQEGLERCGCRYMPPAGQRVKKNHLSMLDNCSPMTALSS
jgi:hypothetical protein